MSLPSSPALNSGIDREGCDSECEGGKLFHSEGPLGDGVGASAASGTAPLGLRPEPASSLGHTASVPDAVEDPAHQLAGLREAWTALERIRALPNDRIKDGLGNAYARVAAILMLHVPTILDALDGYAVWQPIDTHPRDGKRMLALDCNRKWRFIYANPELDRTLYTHWTRPTFAQAIEARQGRDPQGLDAQHESAVGGNADAPKGDR